MSREVVLHGEVPRSAPNTTSSVSVGSECHRLENRSLCGENRTVPPSSQERSSLETVHLMRHRKTTSKSVRKVQPA